MASCRFVFVVLLLFSEGTQSDASGQSQNCEKKFVPGREDFVLDTDESIKHGATYLSNPKVESKVECVAACCGDVSCNVALIEDGPDHGSVTNCFLFNCLYKQKYVCRFIQDQHFSNFILESVYEHYLNLRQTDESDKAPIANPGPDMVVQPNEEVLLNGIESWDDKEIINYTWALVKGDQSVLMEKTDLKDQIKVSKLIPGLYEFKLTVTDSGHHSDSAKVTVLVLTAEQSERHCLIPKKVGPCRGSFPRWHYNAASGKCEKFSFGGCKENSNNYLSEKECLDACQNTKVIPGGDVRKLVHEDCTCTGDQFKCANGCCVKKEFECDGEKQCTDGSDEENCQKWEEGLSRLLDIKGNQRAGCTDPPNTGPCRASITRWYYDPSSQKCHRFTYGGCEDNENNFEHHNECSEKCSGVTENDVFSRRLRNVRGAGEDLGESQSASVALAVVLVIAILAMLAVLGYCFLKNRKNSGEHQRVPTTNAPSNDGQNMVYSSTTSKA